MKVTIEDVRAIAAIITTDGGGDAGSGADGAGGSGGGDGGDGSKGDATGGDGASDGAVDISKLFTPEEVEQKKATLAEQQAEEARRAALTDEERTAEDQAKAEQDALRQVPDKYEFKIPEGYTIDAELTADLEAYCKENKLPAGEAQKIADLGAKLLAKQAEQRETQFLEIKEKWLSDAKADKEIGADVEKGKDSVAARAFNTIATPEMKEMINQYGIGNHPEMLRMFYRLAPLMREDGVHMPGSGAGLTGSKGAAETVSGIFNHPSRKKG